MSTLTPALANSVWLSELLQLIEAAGAFNPRRHIRFTQAHSGSNTVCVPLTGLSRPHLRFSPTVGNAITRAFHGEPFRIKHCSVHALPNHRQSMQFERSALSRQAGADIRPAVQAWPEGRETSARHDSRPAGWKRLTAESPLATGART